MKKSMFSQNGNWYKGNLHAHTTQSDGKTPPDQLAQAYKAKGYSFLSITDHNIFDSHSSFNDDSFIILPGTERDANVTGQTKCFHAVGISNKPVAQQITQQLPVYRGMDKSWQELLDEMTATDQTVIIAHPVWSRMSCDELLAMKGHIGVEFLNYSCEVSCRTGFSDYMIDYCLRNGQKLLLFASDDCHCKKVKDDKFGGWIVVKANALTHEDIIAQIKAGSFYGSTGPEIYDFGIEDDCVYISCSDCEAIHFVSYEDRGISMFAEGKPLNDARFKFRGTEKYIRCECVDMYGNRAFTNPIYF